MKKRRKIIQLKEDEEELQTHGKQKQNKEKQS